MALAYMLSALRPARYQPTARARHYAMPIERKVAMWGGVTEDFAVLKRKRQTLPVEMFDPNIEEWQQQATSGEAPPPMYGGACAALGNTLYVCCGHDGTSYRNTLHGLDSDSCEWREVQATNPADGPMPKTACGMIAVDNDKLALIGGFGKPTHPVQRPGEAFVELVDGTGCSNEFHLFDTKESKWSSPAMAGDRLPPCAAFTFTAVDDNRAVLFAGDNAELRKRVNDTYILNHRLMHWTKLQKTGGPWPKERSSHAACCIDYGGENPLLLVSGGFDKDGNALKDAWLLHVNAGTWKEVELPAELQPRCYHSLTAISLAPGLTEVTMFGGCPKWDPSKTEQQLPKLADTVLLRLESVEISPSHEGSSLREWVLRGMTRMKQLGQPESLREKLLKLREHGAFTGAQREYEMGITSEETRPLRQRITALEERVREAERRSEEESRRREEAERRSEEESRRREEAEEARVKAEQGREEERRRREETEREMQQLQARLEEDEYRPSTTERGERATEPSRRRVEGAGLTWVVQREEIKLTEQHLGKGGWAVVKVANFRGIRVAAKCLHEIIISDYNRHLFTREMNLAARIRHPNLLLFIGATIRGELIILTELMPTSLRAVLERGPLTPPQCSSISLDIAAALNYLHLMRPNPIIHRDISSANVLLEPVPNNRWRAKVSDYGSANFLQQLRTENPGAAVYAAPEASTPTQQSTKMDIYSFGVLLVELFTARFPDVDDRERLIQSITDHRLIRLIRQCIAKERNRRLTASDIITQLSSHHNTQ